MRKIIAFICCVSLLIIGTSSPVFAEQNNTVLGLQECIDKILWRGSNHAEVKAKMESGYSTYLDNLAVTVSGNPDFANRKMGLDPDSEIPLDQQVREEFALDYENGIVISSLNTYKYLDEYAKAGCFSYLFNEHNVIVIMNAKRLGYEKFSVEGDRLTGAEDEKVSYNHTVIGDSVYDYLRNTNNIEKDLNANGETIVQNMALFGIGNLTLLYIKCETNEYLVKLHDSSGRIIPAIQPYVLYKTTDVMEAFDNEDVKNSPYSQVLAEYVLTEKPAFSAEAESLQSEGLLLGNENGLDLLKPLTRIEAATMLLRATGESTETETQEQTFSDVPPTYWGYGAAENAYRLGIVNGMGDNRFAPDEDVTAVQFATMVLRAGGNAEFNWEDALNILIEKGIITQENAATMDFFTRGDMAKMIYEAREKGMLG